MSAPQSLPRHMIEFLPPPDNGYQTPNYPEDENVFFGTGLGNEGGRAGSASGGGHGELGVDVGVYLNEIAGLQRNGNSSTRYGSGLQGSLQGGGERRRNPFADHTGQNGVSMKEHRNETAGEGESAMKEEASEPEAVEEKRDIRKVGIRGRVSCYTWTWFTLTMATGGIASVLHTIPYRSEWLRIIGVVFFLFNICLFVTNCFFITLRFKWNPGSFKASFVSQSESLFIPACIVSAGTILTNMCQYGIPMTGPWFHKTMEICFWLYVAVSFLASSSVYLIIWSTQTFPIHTMTPIWIFPAYPLLVTAPFAANLLDALPDSGASDRINTVAMALGALCTQGTGFCVSLMIYSAFIYRLMSQKLPRETARPGMFVSVGPSAFTVAGIMGLGNIAATNIFPHGYLGNENAAFFVKILSDLVGFWLWGLCLWFFLVSVGAHWQLMRPFDPKHHIQFDMTWYSFVFPNTAMVTATFAVAKSVDSNGLRAFGTVLAVLLVILWLFVFGMMIRAFAMKQLLWPNEISYDGQPVLAKKWSLNIPEAGRNHLRQSGTLIQHV